MSLQNFHNEKHYTVPELAELWGVSDDTIRSIFQDDSRVLKIVRPEKMHKRRYVTITIPESVAREVHARLSQGKAA